MSHLNLITKVVDLGEGWVNQKIKQEQIAAIGAWGKVKINHISF